MLQVLTQNKDETERKILETSAVWLKLRELEKRVEFLEADLHRGQSPGDLDYCERTPERFRPAVKVPLSETKPEANTKTNAPELKHVHNVFSMLSSRFEKFDIGEKAKRSYVDKLKGFDVTDLMSAALSIINDIPPFMEPNEQMIIDRCEVFKSRRFQDAAVLDSIRAVKLQISNQTRQASGYLNGTAK